MYKHLSIVTAAALLAAAAPASAATAVYSLAVDGSSTGLGTGPFGSITVTENNGALDISETLFNGFFIHDGNQNHNALAFNLTSSSAVTISALSSGFQLVNNANVSEPPFGSFNYTIDCTSCAAGAASTVNTLSFKATAASGALTLASLSPNLYLGQSIYFTSDVVSTKSGFVGNTGNVGAIAAVPEPATWATFIGGFGLVGGAMRRRQRVQAHFA